MSTDVPEEIRAVERELIALKRKYYYLVKNYALQITLKRIYETGKIYCALKEQYIGKPNDELKELYKKLVLVHHPDKGGTCKMFSYINLLYKTMDLEGLKKVDAGHLPAEFGELGEPGELVTDSTIEAFFNSMAFNYYLSRDDSSISGFYNEKEFIEKFRTDRYDIWFDSVCKKRYFDNIDIDPVVKSAFQAYWDYGGILHKQEYYDNIIFDAKNEVPNKNPFMDKK